MIKVAIVGIGRWGKNLVREFNKLCEITMCYSRGNEANVRWLNENYPSIKYTSNFKEVLQSDADAVVIATPIQTHFNLAIDALNSGKHVFVEKPLATSVSDAKKLISASEKNGKKIFVGHVFLYHPVFQKIKELIKNDPLKYAKFVWNKLGTFEEDIVWNLLSHEVSIALELFGTPKKISKLDEKGVLTNADILSVKMDFDNGRKCVIDLNRVSNVKDKSVTFVTSKNIFLWNNDALYMFNKKSASFEISYKSEKQPLEIECKEFIDCIQNSKKTRTDGKFGLEVVKNLSKII